MEVPIVLKEASRSLVTSWLLGSLHLNLIDVIPLLSWPFYGVSKVVWIESIYLPVSHMTALP